MRPKFYTIQEAGRREMERQLERDEANLFDYDRPLLKDTRKHLNPFQTNAAIHGWVTACLRYIAP